MTASPSIIPSVPSPNAVGREQSRRRNERGPNCPIGAFKQFWSGNKKPQGLELGLALTQGIARLHGCEFTIQLDADATTVTVLVPRES